MRSFDPTEFHRLPVRIIVVPIKENLIKTCKSCGTCVFYVLITTQISKHFHEDLVALLQLIA